MPEEKEGPLEMPFTVTLEIEDSRGKVLRTQVKLDAFFMTGILNDGKGGEITSFVAGDSHDILAAVMPALTQVAAMQFRIAHQKKSGDRLLTHDAADDFFQSLDIKPPPSTDGETP